MARKPVLRVTAGTAERSAPIALTLARDSLTLARDGLTSGHLTVPCRYDGKPLTIGIPARYVRDMLAGLKGDVRLYLGGSGDPVRFEHGPDETAWTGVVMPIRI